MTWPYRSSNLPTCLPTYLPLFENTLKGAKEQATFEMFDYSDEETWPDQQKYNDKDTDKDNDKDNYI